MVNYKKVNFDRSLSIVVPLHNKGSNIESTLSFLIDKVYSSELEIIVIENESTDNSKKIALNFINNINSGHNIKLIESKKGLGHALIKGFEESKFEWIYFVPADCSFGNSELDYVVENNLHKNFDLFIGSKGHPESIIYRSISRRFYSSIFNSILKIVFKAPFNDTQGTLLFKSSILKEISKLQNKEFLITSELIIKSFYKNKRIVEIPIIDMKVDTTSTVNPLLDGFKMIVDLIKLKIYILKN